jgi:hypothetical protein
MIVFTHNKKQYTIANEWNDITLQTAISLSSVDVPAVDDIFDWFQHLEVVKVVMSKFSTFQKWGEVHPTEMVALFSKYCLPMLQDLRSDTPKTYTPQLITSFVHSGVTYLLPTTLDIGGETILQHGQKVKNFIEASNLMKAFSEMKSDGIKVMPYFIATIVKIHPEEAWSDIEVSNRAKEFETLPMNIVWEVFFCTSQLIFKHQINILQSMTKEMQKPTNLRSRLVLKLGRLRLQKAELMAQLRR